ncbi:MAG: hypothetical protein U5M23_04290 [Marinagarivorans sp.]|nr:hypothetical protein [Marinagarivorans sp.]
MGVKALATSADARAPVTQGLADTYSEVARGDASAIGQWTGFFGQVGTGGVSSLGGKQVLSATASAAAKTVNAAKAVASTGATASVTVARGIVAGGNQLGKMAESVVGKAKQAAVSWSDAANRGGARNIAQHAQYLDELRGLQRADYLKELSSNGIKHNPANIVDIRRTSGGQLAFLETGTADAGLAHVMRHADDFAKRGVHVDQISDLVITAVERGKIIGYQGRGTGRPIYEVIYNDTRHHVAVTVSNNGFIVGANPARIK